MTERVKFLTDSRRAIGLMLYHAGVVVCTHYTDRQILSSVVSVLVRYR